MDGLYRRLFDEPGFEAVVEEDVRSGRHANPDDRPGWFTTAYFHEPAELGPELAVAGFALEGVFAIERVEAAPALLGASAHLLAVGRR